MAMNTHIFSGQFYTILKFGIVILSLVESYIFPFAIVKWMVVVSNYSGYINSLGTYKIKRNSVCRYKYKLQLLTVCKKSLVTVNEVSHVNLVADCNGIQV